jgi:hypothetical protein
LNFTFTGGTYPFYSIFFYYATHYYTGKVVQGELQTQLVTSDYTYTGIIQPSGYDELYFKDLKICYNATDDDNVFILTYTLAPHLINLTNVEITKLGGIAHFLYAYDGGEFKFINTRFIDSTLSYGFIIYWYTVHVYFENFTVNNVNATNSFNPYGLILAFDDENYYCSVIVNNSAFTNIRTTTNASRFIFINNYYFFIFKCSRWFVPHVITRIF